MDTGFLPSLPFLMSYPLLFGVLLVTGMLGGEIAHSARLPRIIGYVIVGFVAAPIAEAAHLRPLIEEARIFVDLALGLVLFDLGRRVDLQWMARDRSLAASGLFESGLAFGATFFVLEAFDFPPLKAALAAAIAMATSPAVVLLVAQDTRAEGQVTERALNLVAMNSLVASILVTMLFAAVHYQRRIGLETAILHPLYLFVGSVALGAAMAALTRVVARRLEKTKDLHFTLIAGMVVAAVGVATSFKLSVILSLLAFGLFARNAERAHDLLAVDLGRASRLLYIVLFVITGASLPLDALASAGWVAVAFVGARALAKLAGIAIVAPFGGLHVRQVIGLGAALVPMSSLALLLEHDISANFPGFGPEFSAVVLGGVIIVEILGPLAVQWGFWISGETEPAAQAQAARVPAEKAT
jgi:Kef-type K+ transport system membrane component KefB